MYKGDFVVVLSKSDFMGNLSEWWKCCVCDGRIGYFFVNFFEVMCKFNEFIVVIKNIFVSESSRISFLISFVSVFGMFSMNFLKVFLMLIIKVGDVIVESF